MTVDVPLLARICEAPGAPGFEKPIRDLVRKELEEFGDAVRVDGMGSVVVHVKGQSSEKKVMAAAHMDEIGFIVTHIDDQGFLRFNPIGGFDAKTLTAQRVIVHGKEDIVGVMGTKPIHIMSDEERRKLPKIEDYFIDLGLSKSEVEKVVSVGDSVTRERNLIEMGDCVNVKSLDNRASVYLLIETLRKLKDTPPAYDFYGVFTVQEEVGIRGANASALEIQPDFGFGLDTTIAFDTPGAKPEERCTQLGKGAGIKLMDSSVICDQRMVAYLKSVAGKHEITWQPEILKRGGTDTAGIQRMSPGGAIAGAISIPTRNVHQVIEMCHKDDIANAIELLTAALVELDQWDWRP
ncbi:MAG: M42 family metallopeptidase [Verrucomicrobiota bacterium JB023]|nr:M42 family metallopeptidase [Verrucomicrobiota bacterium JB023]